MPTNSAAAIEAPSALLETLIARLTASPHFSESLPQVVEVMTAAVGRPSGALLLFSNHPGEAPVIFTHQLPDLWAAQLPHSDSPLRQLAQRALTAEAWAAPRPELEVAAVVRVLASLQCVGVLLVNGAPCAPAEAERLALLGRVVGQVVQLEQWRDAIQERALARARADLEVSRWEVIRSRSTLMALFDGILNPIYIVDRDYKLVAVNKTCARQARPLGEAASAGYAPQALVGHTCYQTLYHRAEPCPGCRVAETFATGQSTLYSERRAEDETLLSEWDITTYPIRNEGNQVAQVIVFSEDVTEKRQLEASLAQSEKMAAVGQLAAGVAHEINNPLAAIIANTQLLQRESPPDEDWKESLELISRAGDRALRVVRSLLDFARQDNYAMAPTHINASIESATALILHQFRSQSVELICDFAPDLPQVQASHDHLQGVWLNMLLNARDALSGGPGAVHVTTRQIGKEVRVLISDTGVGIPFERLPRIFEPFFTTKAPGRGTGLGLAVCHQIIKQHGGRILVESEVGKGTTFTICLPTSPSGIYRREMP